jgi:hypothetical protein
MRPDSIRLSRRHKIALYATLAAVFASGAAWAWMHYLAHAANEFGASLAETWTLAVHGLVAAGSLLFIGALLPLHIKFAWRANRNRSNGILMLFVVCLLIITGYALYYIGNERLRSWTSWTHLIVGLTLPAFLIIHIWRGRATRNVKRSRHHSPATRNILVK